MATPARAAVAGNPSDGFGGAVCSLIVPQFAASASVSTAGQRPGIAGEPLPLVQATVDRFIREVGPVPEGLVVNIESTIPRSVGLAGSSAIVIDVIRLLCGISGRELTAMEVAHLAHQVERADLSIAGGWQDQLIQSHGYSALMDFSSEPSIRPLSITSERGIPMYLAWATTTSAPSGEAHAALRAGPTPDRRVIDALATAATDAASGFETGDVHLLKSAIDASFDLRAEMMALDPRQARLVEDARNLGACANYAGSGGAILGVLPKQAAEFVAGMTDCGLVVETFIAR